MKDTGSCRGAGGSMHIFDKEKYFQGGWALVAEQLPYACGAAKSILLDRAMGLSDDDKIIKQNVVIMQPSGLPINSVPPSIEAAAADGPVQKAWDNHFAAFAAH